ncbi:helix-turn-helix domain-containing protein [Selenomonas sp. oral taxon 136]|uniref:helix-turn-helix domain-containing protein n=1 Tax=Selenomonas sp. oral taxon 136 TaxID=713030 RepID=UPI0007681043|nr:helix-turn-helix transcriptional regulator [Selenomonas sp. oral taxon 136]AME03635.1 hypothetical protein AXE86_05875 [Selenomonas sp. oral taxon 136]
MESNGLHERIKAVRKSLTPKMSQTVFAEALGTKRDTIANYEGGRVIPTDTFIQLLCTKFNISEDWLRTGEGEMYKDEGETLFANFARQYGLTEKEQQAARYLLSLSSEERQQISHYLGLLIRGMQNDDAKKAEVEKRDQAHRMLDAELDAEQKGQSASTSGSSAAKMA